MKSEANINKRCIDFKLITLAITIINGVMFLDDWNDVEMKNKRITKLIEMSKNWMEIFCESTK